MSDQGQPSLVVDREELYSRLGDVAPPLADLYRGALQLLALKQMPGRAHFLAHAAREIANGLPEWITGVATEKESLRLNRLANRWQAAFPGEASSDGGKSSAEMAAGVLVPRGLYDEVADVLSARYTHAASRDAVQRLFTWLGPGNRYLATDLPRLVSEWMDLRTWFESTNKARRSREAAPPDDQAAIAHFEQFERWLAFLLKGFFAARRDLDLILEEATPNRLPGLLPLLVPDQQRKHFFDKLAEKADPTWLRPLEHAGLFAHPPPVVVEKTEPQTFVHAAWPASAYLARMAVHPEAQESVAAIASQILSTPDIRNSFVQKDLLDVALVVPTTTAARFSRKMRSWGDGLHHTVTKKLGTLAVRLAQGGQTRDALLLMRALLLARRPVGSGPQRWLAEPEPRIGRWGLTTIVEEALPEFIAATGLKGFSLVCKLLARALHASRDSSGADGNDHSHIWRPIIESKNVDHGSAAPELLAAAVVRSALQLSEAGSPLRDLLEVLESQRWRVFRRIAQYLLVQAPTVSPEALRAHLLQRAEFESFHREYRMLLEAGFLRLVPGDQTAILGWIETGPDAQRVQRHLEFWKGQEPLAEDVERERRRWRWRRLGPLTASLSAEWKERQRELNGEFGTPPPNDEPDFRTSAGSVGRASPLSRDEGRSLSVREIAQRVATWQPPSDGTPLLPADGEVLGELIAEDPERFAAEAGWFRGLKPPYVRAMFNGLERAARQGKRFGWGPVLDLASWVLTQEPVERHNHDPWVDEREWEWSRGAVARMLRAGLPRPDVAPPIGLRQHIWPLIEGLNNDPPLNRAEAIGAAMQYALWLKRGDSQLFVGAPEVAKFLELQVAEDRPGMPEVHAELGEWLSWLAWYAPAWTLTNLDRVLPSADELWKAAWESHLRGPVPQRRAFEVLRSAYLRAVEQLRPGDPDLLPGVKADSTLTQERLAEHLVVLYGRGDLEATGTTAILDALFERGTPALRRHALWVIGRSLASDETELGAQVEPPPEVLERFRQLWEARVKRLQADPSVREELPAFGSWFACGRFENAWALDELERVLHKPHFVEGEPILDQPSVVRRLGALVKAEPVRTTRLLKQLVDLANDGSVAYGWLDEAREIVGVAIRSGDPEARKAVVGLLDRLGALGFRDIRDVVPSSHDLDDPLTIPYFLWDQPLTVAQFRDRLSFASQPERDRMLGLLLREASDVDVWKFTSPEEVLARWSAIEKHLGRRRAFWSLLLKKWQEQGLLAR
jgi:hypothetical protein